MDAFVTIEASQRVAAGVGQRAVAGHHKTEKTQRRIGIAGQQSDWGANRAQRRSHYGLVDIRKALRVLLVRGRWQRTPRHAIQEPVGKYQERRTHTQVVRQATVKCDGARIGPVAVFAASQRPRGSKDVLPASRTSVLRRRSGGTSGGARRSHAWVVPSPEVQDTRAPSPLHSGCE